MESQIGNIQMVSRGREFENKAWPYQPFTPAGNAQAVLDLQILFGASLQCQQDRVIEERARSPLRAVADAFADLPEYQAWKKAVDDLGDAEQGLKAAKRRVAEAMDNANRAVAEGADHSRFRSLHSDAVFEADLFTTRVEKLRGSIREAQSAAFRALRSAVEAERDRLTAQAQGKADQLEAKLREVVRDVLLPLWWHRAVILALSSDSPHARLTGDDPITAVVDAARSQMESDRPLEIVEHTPGVHRVVRVGDAEALVPR